jgi:hypothetical protein
MFCLSKCGVECIYVFRIDKSQERPNVADWPQGGTDRPSEGHPSSSSAPKPGRTVGFGSSRACDPGYSNQERALCTHWLPLAKNLPSFRLSVISLIRNTNRKSLNSLLFKFIYSLWLHSTAWPPQQFHTTSNSIKIM